MAYVNQGLSFPPAALKRIEDLENLVQERTAERDAWADKAHQLADEARFHQMKSGRTNRTKLGWHEWSDWWECTARSLGYVDDDPPGNGKKGKKAKARVARVDTARVARVNAAKASKSNPMPWMLPVD